jgi:hypothetical protein
MFIGVSDDVALVVRRVVPIPMILVHVRNTVHAATFVMFDFRFSMDVAVRRRCLRNVALIGVNLVMLFPTLGERGQRHEECQRHRNCEANLHRRNSS